MEERFRPIPWAPQYGISADGECFSTKRNTTIAPIMVRGDILVAYQLKHDGRKRLYDINDIVRATWGHELGMTAQDAKRLRKKMGCCVTSSSTVRTEERLAYQEDYRRRTEEEKRQAAIDEAAKKKDEIWSGLKEVPFEVSSWSAPIMDPMSTMTKGYPLAVRVNIPECREVAA